LLHPSSLASDALRPFQLTPLRTAVAVVQVLVVLAFITAASATVAFTAVAFTAVQRYAVGWPWASVLLPSVLLLTAHTEVIAADTIPIQPATRTDAEPGLPLGALA
jgi:hypothetical protein